MAIQVSAKVIENKLVAPGYYRMVLAHPVIASAARPGQFLQVRVSEGDDVLLRRPFGFHRVSKGSRTFAILYEVRGKGTEKLSRKKAGECLDVVGPLGHGFEYTSAAQSPLSVVLVAGGMGVAPLLFLAEELVHSRRSTVHRKPLILIGARSKNGLLCETEFRNLGYSVKVATDDGSKGFKGKVTSLLKNVLSTVDCGPWTIFGCGPRPMLQEVSRLARRHNTRAQISLEAHMACGIGACLGCVIQTKRGYQRVCHEGPVFDALEIEWAKEG